MKNSPSLLMDNDLAKDICIQVFEHLADWPIKTPQKFRNAILGDGIFVVNPSLDIKHEKDALYLQNVIKDTVSEGRMIDFGFIPNELIKSESIRSHEMFEAGEFQHPYDNWLAFTQWEGGTNGYHISPHPDDPSRIIVIELYGVSVPHRSDAIIVYDIISAHVKGDKSTTTMMPFPSKIPEMETKEEAERRCSNSLDPMVTMLRLLADASVSITPWDAPHKLNRTRAKQGKFLIPSHTVVNTHDYVAHYTTHSTRSNGAFKGGTHASPVAHWRRAHTRHLADGRVIPVKSSKVNWRDAHEMHRLFYKV